MTIESRNSSLVGTENEKKNIRGIHTHTQRDRQRGTEQGDLISLLSKYGKRGRGGVKTENKKVKKKHKKTRWLYKPLRTR
jgi:hypothetical protein